jgi:fructosamine-3-kinase
MSVELPPVIEAVRVQLGWSIREITAVSGLSGGDISQAFRLDCRAGQSWFCKVQTGGDGSMFSAEVEGLRQLADCQLIRVPQVHDYGCLEGGSFLILEWIEPAHPPADFMQRFGKQLALLHRDAASILGHPPASSPQQRFGNCVNNFLGLSRQDNSWQAEWIPFFLTHRLEPQLQQALAQKRIDSIFWSAAKDLLRQAERWLLEPVAPALLHGDLWSGNYLCDAQGSPVLIDPAVYWGHAEAEFGMLSLFGGVSEEFFTAYDRVLPPIPDRQRRVALYQWYHLLNHLNLFGVAYLPACQRVMRELLS